MFTAKLSQLIQTVPYLIAIMPMDPSTETMVLKGLQLDEWKKN